MKWNPCHPAIVSDPVLGSTARAKSQYYSAIGEGFYILDVLFHVWICLATSLSLAFAISSILTFPCAGSTPCPSNLAESCFDAIYIFHVQRGGASYLLE